jgi:TonB family protein
MIHPRSQNCNQNHDNQARIGPDLRRARSKSVGFWLSLTGGSIAVHILLIHVVQAESWQQSRLLPTPTPIELVDLPAAPPALEPDQLGQKAAPAGQSKKANQSASRVESRAINRPVLQNPALKEFLPQRPDLQASAAPTSPQPTPQRQIAAQIAAAVSKPEPVPNSESVPNLEPVPNSGAETEPQTGIPQTGIQPQKSQIEPQIEPELETEQIEVPIPDISNIPSTSTTSDDAKGDASDQVFENDPESISEEIPEESSEPVSEEPALEESISEESVPETTRAAIPAQLTASLTTDAAPLETSESLPDQTAQPKTEVKRISRRSPCRVTPEVVKFLGKTVALQVATDETGQVVDTVTQESSENLAYDRLAVCLVENWEFKPAIAQGQAVANDGLVVRITIDRS